MFRFNHVLLSAGLKLPQWTLTINSEDRGMLIATMHAACLKATDSLTAASQGGSFRFMPVPGEKGWYL
jgi:hypothetical protein